MSQVATVDVTETRESPVKAKESGHLSVIKALLPWIGYAVITLILLRALLPVVADHLPGLTDGWQNVWNLWWMRYSLLDLHTNPFFSHYIYYPNGASLLLHTYAPLNGILALPFTAILGPLPTVNLLIISSFVFTGMAAYALGRGLGLGRFEAWLAGAVYAFCNPPRWQYFAGGQADHLAMQWMPLYILCLVKATSPEEEITNDQLPITNYKSPATVGHWTFDFRLLTSVIHNSKFKIQNSPRVWLLGAVIFYAFCAFTDWQFFVYMSVFSAIYAIYLLLRARNWKERLLTVRNLALIAGGTALIVSPLLVPTILEASHPGYAVVPPIWQTLLHSLDLTTYIVPNESNPLWGGWAAQQAFPGSRVGNAPGLNNPGYVPFALALVGLVFYARRVYQWAIFGLIFAVLALGPGLGINGETRLGAGGAEVPMPYALLVNLPFFNISRDPGRFAATAFLCVGLLAGFGWMALRTRFGFLSSAKTGGLVAMTLVVVITVGEFGAMSYPITTQQTPGFFHKLRDDPETYALLEMPIAEKFYAEYTEALQSIHHKRILGGQTARKPCYCFPMQTPVLRWFWDYSLPPEDDIVPNPPPSSYAPAILRYFDIRYIVLYKKMQTAEQYDIAQSLVKTIMPTAQPIEDDEVAAIYEVPPISSTTIMPVQLVNNWGELEQSARGPQRWVGSNPATFVVVNATSGERPAQMELKVHSYHQQRTLQIVQGSVTVASVPIHPALQTVAVELRLAPGRNLISLRSVEAAVRPSKVEPGSQDTRLLAFAVLGISVK